MLRALAILLLLFAPAQAEPTKVDWPYSCCAKIQAGGRGGSATLVAKHGKRGLVVTAAHVVGASHSVTLWFPDGYKVTGRVLESNRTLDLAVVEADVPEGMFTTRRIRAANEKDAVLTAVGYPAYDRSQPRWTQGAFGGYRGHKVIVNTPRPISSGYSGGMLIAPDGSYCGATNWTSGGKTLAASGREMENFLARWVKVGTP